MEWFNTVFLPSLYDRRKMVRGKTVTYLTEKQAHICRRYMSVRICTGDYGQFYIMEHIYNGDKIQLCEEGKYLVLYW